MLTEAEREGRFQFDAKRLSAALVPNGSENFPERAGRASRKQSAGFELPVPLVTVPL
jgi:hypothetical protein